MISFSYCWTFGKKHNYFYIRLHVQRCYDDNYSSATGSTRWSVSGVLALEGLGVVVMEGVRCGGGVIAMVEL